jgi:hypothetical protein
MSAIQNIVCQLYMPTWQDNPTAMEQNWTGFYFLFYTLEQRFLQTLGASIPFFAVSSDIVWRKWVNMGQ